MKYISTRKLRFRFYGPLFTVNILHWNKKLGLAPGMNLTGAMARKTFATLGDRLFKLRFYLEIN